MADNILEEVLHELEIMEINMDSEMKKTTSEVVKKYGFFPYSVMRVGNDKVLEKLCGDDIATNTYTPKKRQKDASFRMKESKRGYKSVNNGLSRFNTAVAKRLIEYYTDKGDTVLTPFGSRGIITIVAAHLGRKGVVCEVNEHYAEHIKGVIDNLNSKKALISKKYDATCYHTNANNMHMIETDSIDTILTSPPFWNIEKYESCEGQLSDINDYDDFLVEYQKCLNECYRVMKPGGLAIFVINDFRVPRRKGEESTLIRFSLDTELGLNKAGFETYDIGINFLYSTPSVIGVNECARRKRFLKSHEYILVMRKTQPSIERALDE